MSALRGTALFLVAGLALTACSSNEVSAPTATASLVEVSKQPAATSSSPTATATTGPSAASSSPTSVPSPTVIEATPQPTETPVKAINPPAQSAVAGTSCGPSNTGRTILVLAEGNAPCTEVQQVFADFNAQFQGGTNTVAIGDYQCHSYTVEDTELTGRTVSCTGKGNRLEAMTHYQLGGSPLPSSAYYTFKGDVYFMIGSGNNKIGCHIGDIGVDCMRGTAGDPMQGAFEFFGHGKNGVPVIQAGGGNPGPNPYYEGPTLQPGQNISAFGSICKYDGNLMTCTNGSQTFVANDTEFKAL